MIIASNKKGFFDYEILDTYTAGIVLVGSEVKSVRNKDVSIKEAFCHVANGEIWIKGMHIAQFKESGTYQNHEPVRDRKLLLNKREIIKLQEKSSQKGLTIIPLKVILTSKGLIKIDVGLAKGKNTRDKRNSIRERDILLDNKRDSNMV